MFVTNLRTFPPGVLETTHSKEWDGQQTENIMPPATAIVGVEA